MSYQISQMSVKILVILRYDLPKIISIFDKTRTLREFFKSYRRSSSFMTSRTLHPCLCYIRRKFTPR